MERCVIYYSWWLLCAVKHAMIVTEYMENGALDRYLRVSPQHTVCTNATIFVSIATKKLLKTQERALKFRAPFDPFSVLFFKLL